MSKKEIFHIKGMKCENCTLQIEKALVGVGGVITSTVDHIAGKATVEFNENVATVDDFKKAIVESGYQLEE